MFVVIVPSFFSLVIH